MFAYKELPVYANPQMCRLVGYSQEEILLADRLELVLTTRTKFSFQRTLLGVWYANPLTPPELALTRSPGKRWA